MKSQSNPHILMCRPEHFGVLYAINPWMDPSEWERDERTLAAASHSQWMALRKTLRDLGARIELVPPVPGVPDLVFTANAAVVMDRRGAAGALSPSAAPGGGESSGRGLPRPARARNPRRHRDASG